MLALLQKKAKLSIFTEEFLVSEAMAMSDRQYELYVEKKHARKEGLEEGRAEGRAEGLTEGANAKAREMAKKMLEKNKPIEEIIEFTELSESEVLSIKASLV
jgi:predicted transposase/invertase (TIGR01784 family)